jgi:hypothetical protein
MIGNKTTIQLITDRFSEFQEGQIEHLYQQDPSFSEICRDYVECIQMRDKYASDTTDRNAPRYKQEYIELIESLEEEMLAILREKPGKPR